MRNITLFVKLSRPFFLVGAALVYALGVGVVKFLGSPIDWGMYWLGQAWITFMQLSTHYLNEYFDFENDAVNPNRTPFSGGSGVLGENGLPRQVALWAAITALTFVASLTVLVLRQTGFVAEIVLLMVLIFLAAFFYSTPPLKLSGSGYGELTTAVLVSNLVPALGFLLQTGEFHRLLAMSTFPLTFLHFSMMLSLELPDYGTDLKHDKQTLMVRIGWQNGMRLHNYSILMAYLILALALIFGLPFSIGFPGLLTLPLGIFQIWYMTRIADGIKPNWSLLGFTAITLYGLTTYLLTFALWTR